MRLTSRLGGAVCLVGILVSHSALAADVSPPTARIHNGTEAELCAFPGIVLLDGCTGTLVHPELVIYAAHCGTMTQVRFGEVGNGPIVAVAQSAVNPDYDIADPQGGEPVDWAFARLAEPVVDVPIIPVGYGCEAELLHKVDQAVYQVGFGDPTFGTKGWVKSAVSEVAEGYIAAGSGKGHACPGDSGGPLLARLPDESWRTIGIASTIWGEGGCGDPNAFNHYSRLRPEAVAWFEAESGVDITPCFDPDGTWNPTPACAHFFAGDTSGSGSWDDGCAGTPTQEQPDFCMPQDTTGPEIAITSPVEGEAFDSGSDVTVAAQGADESGIATVDIFLDGSRIASLEAEPYELVAPGIADGRHTMLARATDASDNANQAESVPVAFVVGQVGDDDDDTGDDDDDSTGDDDDDTTGETEDDPATGTDTGDTSTGTGTGTDHDAGDDDAGSTGDLATCSCRQSTPRAWTGAFLLGGLALARRRRN